MISDSDSGEEIIFNYTTINETLKNEKETSTTRQTVAQEPIDLEIILLEPKSRRPSSLRSIRRDKSLRSDSDRSEKSIDLREFDPFAPDDEDDKLRGVDDDETKSTISESGLSPKDEEQDDETEPQTLKLSKSNSIEQESPETRKGAGKSKRSPTIDASLLDKMERRYRRNRVPKADDGSHIDYMDYF